MCLCVFACVYPNSSRSVSSPCQVFLRLWKHSQFWEREALAYTHTQRCTSINQLGHQGDLSSQKQARCHVQMMGCWRANTPTRAQTHPRSSFGSKLVRHWSTVYTQLHTHRPSRKHTHKHNSNTHVAPKLITGPLIKKNDAPLNYLPEEDGEKRGIWTKGGPMWLGGGTDRQLMAAAPSVY